MILEDKLAYLCELSNNTTLTALQKNQILQFCHDADSEVRMRASELLSLFPFPEAESALLMLLKDKNYMVRASACDSLSFYKTKTALNSLIDATKDKSVMVRGYAVLSLADIQVKMEENKTTTVNYLKKMLSQESSEWVKIIIYRSLFLLGEVFYYPLFLKQLNHTKYRNRCLMLNLLEDLLERNALQFTEELRLVLQERHVIETTDAVKKKIEIILNQNS